MKIAVIGVSGHIGIVLHGVETNPDLELVGIAPGDAVDSKEQMRSISERFGDAPLFDDYRVMLDQVKPDVVGVSTRYDLNGPVSMHCLERGIHCMTEKCVASDHETLATLRRATEDNGTKIIGMHAMRYVPAYYAAKQAVADGLIGNPRLFTGQKSYRFGKARPEFYKRRDHYGGTLLWVASHAIDWAYWIMGDFATVHALHSAEDNFDYGDCESHAVMSFSFKNGGIGTINCDFYQPMKSKVHGDDRMRVAGPEGVVEVRYGKTLLTTHEAEERELPFDRPDDEPGDFFGDFCRELRGEGTCRLSMEDTFAVTKLCLLARDAADQGGRSLEV